MKLFFDVFFGYILLVFLIIPMTFVAVIVRLTLKGPVFYWSNRVGKDGTIFTIPKFRFV
jgi:O-antigen biosynthesis protein WbqP